MPKRIYFGVFLMVIVLLAGCTLGSKNGTNDTLQFTVSIYDLITEDLITDEVHLTLDGQGYTTSSGTYEFSNVSPGTKHLEASLPGYYSGEKSITITADKQKHSIYLTPEDQPVQGLVTNVRNAGISLTNVWEPQVARLEKHIREKAAPFTDELGQLLYALMEPLNDPHFTIDLESDGQEVYFSPTYISSSYPTFTVEYALDIAEFLEQSDTGEQNLLNVSFKIYEGTNCVAHGQGELSAYIIDPAIYNEWIKWLDDPNYDTPDHLFFSEAEMTADAWFRTPSFGKVEANSDVALDLDTMTILVNGVFESEVMYQFGELSMVFTENTELPTIDFPFYPTELEFKGRFGFPEIAEIEGQLDATFVPNNYHETIVPDTASLFGSYRDLHSNQEETLAQGSFEYDWSNAALFRNDYSLGLTAEFQGFVQEPQRPKIELGLIANFEDLRQGDVTIDYSYGTHYLQGTAEISHELDDWGNLVPSADIQLNNEHGIRIRIVLDDNLLEENPRIGEITDSDGELLAKLELLGGIPLIFYPDGHFESLL